MSPVTLWLTGLPGAGKTTLARAVAQSLQALQQPCCVLDGDELRRGLCRDLGYSTADRHENVRRVAEMARLLNASGIIAIVALISPQRTARARAREILGTENMLEVHVNPPLGVCQARDPKGLYRLALNGQMTGLTGVDDPYEPPLYPDLMLDTSILGGEECVRQLLERMNR